jgi:stage II sporulation protein R
MRSLKFLLFSAVLAALLCTRAYSKNTQKDISKSVIRFHVLANSDSDYDQKLKLKVRDAVLSDFRFELENTKTREETINFLERNVESIRKSAETELAKNGSNYPVKVTVQKDYFPTKKYGDVTLPSGDYDALRIEIGKAEGHNWWCVVFPPLCYVDITQPQISEKEKSVLKNNLSADEYSLVTDDTAEVRVKLKIMELWNR